MPSTNEVVGTIHYNFDPLYVIITITAGLTYKATLNAQDVVTFVRGVILDAAIHQHSRGARLVIAFNEDADRTMSGPGTRIAGTMHVSTRPPRVVLTIKEGLVQEQQLRIKGIVDRLQIPTTKATVTPYGNTHWLIITIVTPSQE
jgi:hypothetical protein